MARPMARKEAATIAPTKRGTLKGKAMARWRAPLPLRAWRAYGAVLSIYQGSAPPLTAQRYHRRTGGFAEHKGSLHTSLHPAKFSSVSESGKERTSRTLCWRRDT